MATRLPRLPPVDTLAHRSNPPRRRFGLAWWVLSLLGHGAAILAVMTLVGPTQVEAPPADMGVSMVFADVVVPEPQPPDESPPLAMQAEPPPPVVQDEPPPPAVATAEPSPDAVSLPAPPEPTPIPLAERLPSPAAHAPPPRPARSASRPVRPTPPGAAASARAEPTPVAAIIPPRPVAGMADNRPPRYPESARRRQEQGRVMVGVSVATDGTPIDTRVDASSGHPALDEAAMDAVRRWRFVPGTQNDRPVVASAQVPIVFRLQD